MTSFNCININGKLLVRLSVDTWGKIRAMINYTVEILGMNAFAGAEFIVTKDIKMPYLCGVSKIPF